MMKINLAVRALLSNAIREVAHKNNVDINEMCEYKNAFDGDSIIFYGVNWGGWGTQSAEETKQFAEGLLRAAKIAEELNKLEIVIDWNSEKPKVDVDEYEKCFKGLVGLLELADAELIETALQNFNKKFS